MPGKLILTEDGSHTIYVPELDEHYHSIHGAIQESKYIFINNGFTINKSDPVNIFEAGFGTGLNAFMTAIESIRTKRKVNYVSIEKYPLEEEMAMSLNYQDILGHPDLFRLIHSSGWNIQNIITDTFSLKKLRGDLITDNLTGTYDLVYFDAFGPGKQPEIWSQEVFRKISDITKKGGMLVTYSVKGEVKRNLRSSGFELSLLPGPPGKRQILRAVKI